ncbi:MAG: hypothetical protein JEZ11_03925 [Desulfobacterales bacterium]|nr:hypothetical protein [Desulfobacterales bacterium]
MKRIASMLTVIALIAALITIGVGTAIAADQLLDTKVDSVVTKIDRNGNAYVRAIISEKKEISGVAYDATTAVMFFGEQVAFGKTLKAGSPLKAIVAANEYKGRVSYTVLARVN